jgi:hypothetical protein
MFVTINRALSACVLCLSRRPSVPAPAPPSLRGRRTHAAPPPSAPAYVKGFQKVGILFKPQTEGTKPTEAEFEVAEVIKIDPLTDLALLQLATSPSAIRPIALGSESDIQVGADVHAIGHPTGEAWTYTKGFISQYRKNYEWKTAEQSHRAAVIQTQTPINPGNSGGPLISDDAKLVGVNAFKATGEAGHQGSRSHHQSRRSGERLGGPKAIQASLHSAIPRGDPDRRQ